MTSRFSPDETFAISLEDLIAEVGGDVAASLANFDDISAVHTDCWSEEEIAAIDAAISKLVAF
jgi:hypothetical protein